MVRKVILLIISAIALLTATCGAVLAETYSIYEGSPSSTYIQYFRDVMPKLNLGDNYVAFRSGQYEYTMVTGDIAFDSGIFSSEDSCTVYTIENNNSYNGRYIYNVGEITSFNLVADDNILYSDLGYYPELEERGAKYEVLTAILIIIICVSYVARFILNPCKR